MKKCLTFSYDDGVVEDIRLIELLTKYDMKGSFNLNSGLFGIYKEFVQGNTIVKHQRIKEADIRHVYDGQEVAVHTVTHANLGIIHDREIIIKEVEEDRKRLEELLSYEIVGMAYAGGGVNYNDVASEVIKKDTKVKYARTNRSSYNFDFPENVYQFHATIRHSEMEKLFELGEAFLKMKADTPKIFSVWGHSYEFEQRKDWGQFEEFLQMMSGKEDICYCTNREALLEVYV